MIRIIWSGVVEIASFTQSSGFIRMLRVFMMHGDRTYCSTLVDRFFHSDGQELTIGGIADSFDHWNTAHQDVLKGFLPGPENPYGYRIPVQVLQEGAGTHLIDEGRVLLQLIHQKMTHATLLFHTSLNQQGHQTDNSLRVAIDTLINSGANLIVINSMNDVDLLKNYVLLRQEKTTEIQLVQNGIIFLIASSSDIRLAAQMSLMLEDSTA